MTDESKHFVDYNNGGSMGRGCVKGDFCDENSCRVIMAVGMELAVLMEVSKSTTVSFIRVNVNVTFNVLQVIHHVTHRVTHRVIHNVSLRVILHRIMARRLVIREISVT